MSVTVVTYCTPDFAFFIEGISQDCQRLGMDFYHEVLPRNFKNLIKAFDHKIIYLENVLQKFEKVLWLDVECRLHKNIPDHWQSPTISSYDLAGKRGLSSGLLLLDQSHLPILSVWSQYARWYTRLPDDFILEFLIEEFGWDFKFVDLEFFDRTSKSPVARGEWLNEHTVVSHPSTNRWPYPKRYSKAFNGWWGARKKASRLRKNLFYRNFAGDFDEIDDLMRNGRQIERINNWVFDPRNGTYAPCRFWPNHHDNYFFKPRSFEKSKESFYRPQRDGGYRRKMVDKIKRI